jgi:gamma-glutamylcyclotransferase (GGCT)/AIG2-like uncharacterized protein YtfP
MAVPRDNRAVAPLFVYGSLMSGETHAPELAGAEFLGVVRTAPSYTLISLGRYPGMLSGGQTAVSGELYDVAAPHLTALDVFEEHPDVYCRQDVTLADGRPAQAYLLVQPPSTAPVIPGGDWRRR